MGWGEPHTPRQGDMGAGVLTTSQQLTARAEERRKADGLAAAVALHWREPTTGNAEAMHTALDAYIEARR